MPDTVSSGRNVASDIGWMYVIHEARSQPDGDKKRHPTTFVCAVRLDRFAPRLEPRITLFWRCSRSADAAVLSLGPALNNSALLFSEYISLPFICSSWNTIQHHIPHSPSSLPTSQYFKNYILLYYISDIPFKSGLCFSGYTVVRIWLLLLTGRSVQS